MTPVMLATMSVTAGGCIRGARMVVRLERAFSTAPRKAEASTPAQGLTTNSAPWRSPSRANCRSGPPKAPSWAAPKSSRRTRADS